MRQLPPGITVELPLLSVHTDTKGFIRPGAAIAIGQLELSDSRPPWIPTPRYSPTITQHLLPWLCEGVILGTTGDLQLCAVTGGV